MIFYCLFVFEIRFFDSSASYFFLHLKFSMNLSLHINFIKFVLMHLMNEICFTLSISNSFLGFFIFFLELGQSIANLLLLFHHHYHLLSGFIVWMVAEFCTERRHASHHKIGIFAAWWRRKEALLGWPGAHCDCGTVFEGQATASGSSHLVSRSFLLAEFASC